ncbi:MAG: hypothetical protein U9P42_01485 [Candidatus Fermentibacteria bacterium]|nr:hypothetical protein [Candidatus Fermentibacteria bacterium]
MIFSTVRVGSRIVHGTPAAKVFKVMGFIILGVIGVTALAVLFGLIVMWLWNALMPTIFNLPVIGYWQAVGLVVLAHIFFGSHSSFSNRGSRREKISKKEKGAHIHVESNGRSVSYHNDFDSSGDEGNAMHTDKNGNERHYDSFREFWNDYGREAFDKWLNRNEPKAEPEDL